MNDIAASWVLSSRMSFSSTVRFVTTSPSVDARRQHADIQRAAEAANALEFIESTSDGFDTFIGERGVRLSGGQRQRLAIARAILADPRILILDEATSNLDTQSERLIQASIEQLLRGRTTFAIAHRLSTIRHANLIVVLEHGTCIAQGTHEHLLASNEHYRDMVAAQTAQPEAETDLPDQITCGRSVSDGRS